MDGNLRAAVLTHQLLEEALGFTPAAEGFIPDRTEPHAVICYALMPTENGPDIECGWEGIADLAIYDDTREALWWCPEGHENGWRGEP